MEDTPLVIGAATVDITPSWPMHLVGMGREFVAHDGERFPYARRDEPAAEVHDPLTLQVTWLAAGARAAVVLTADLLYPVALDEVRAAVAEACGVPVDAVLYAATHNHNGPCRTDDYAELLCRRAVDGVRQARAVAAPVAAVHARGHYDRLSHDRAEPWGPVDGGVDVVQLARVDSGRPLAQWWSYACHPCSLSWDSNEVGADYPGALRRHLAPTREGDLPVAFLTGCAANVQPIGMRRFTVPPRMYLGVPKGDDEMVDRLGACLAAAGSRALRDEARPLRLAAPRWRRHRLELPIEVQLDAEALRQRRAELAGPAAAEDADGQTVSPMEAEVARLLVPWLDALLAAEPGAPPTHAVDGTVLALGELAVVFTPLEVAWQIGVRIRERSPFPVTLIATTSLGYESYLTEGRFYELDAAQRPYEAIGMQAAAGFAYTARSPRVFEDGVVAELEALHGALSAGAGAS